MVGVEILYMLLIVWSETNFDTLTNLKKKIERKETKLLKQFTREIYRYAYTRNI